MKSFTKAFLGLSLIMVVCGISAFLIPFLQAHPDYHIVAEKLSNKPTEYFVVTDTDPSLQQAIDNIGEPVPIYPADETNIGESIHEYGTGNLEYKNNYYNVIVLDIEFGLGYPLLTLLWISISGFVISLTILLILVIIKKKPVK